MFKPLHFGQFLALVHLVEHLLEVAGLHLSLSFHFVTHMLVELIALLVVVSPEVVLFFMDLQDR
jgi:hypothetical protein